MDYKNWSFNDTKEWERVSQWFCTSTEQSPINIITDTAIQCKALCDIEFKYKPSKCRVNFKNNLIRFSVDKGSYAIFKGVSYALTEITIHTPSMHNIDDEVYDMEILLIHELSSDQDNNFNKLVDDTTEKSDTDENGIIVSRLFKKGAHHGEPERFISEVINELPSEAINYNKEISVSNDWGASLILPEKKGFYMYNGSKPFPPCTEKYVVVVLEDIGIIGETTTDIIFKHVGRNIRPLKPIYNREIFYNTGIKTKLTLGTNTALTDKYLKCVKTKRDKPKTVLPEPVIEDSKYGFSDKLKKILKNIFFPLTIINLFVVAIFFTKYLFNEVRIDGKIVKGAWLKKIFLILTAKEGPAGGLDTWNGSWGRALPRCQDKKK